MRACIYGTRLTPILELSRTALRFPVVLAQLTATLPKQLGVVELGTRKQYAPRLVRFSLKPHVAFGRTLTMSKMLVLRPVRIFLFLSRHPSTHLRQSLDKPR